MRRRIEFIDVERLRALPAAQADELISGAIAEFDAIEAKKCAPAAMWIEDGTTLVVGTVSELAAAERERMAAKPGKGRA
jgi:hypothetical protein